MIVSIDHGNKSIKTPRLLFTSGLVESTAKPGIQGDYIYWDGK
jgi:plasmid segregation protein ParM